MDRALVVNGVVDTVYRDTDFDAVPDVDGGVWIEVAPGAVFGGFRYEGGEFLPPISEPASIPDLVAYLDQRMVDVETGGTVWNGLPISTTERAQSKVDAALASYADGTRAENQMVTFIASDGSPQTIDQATLLSIKQAVVDHVAGSFTAYGVIHPQIIDGTITTREAIRDHVEWPSNGGQPQP